MVKQQLHTTPRQTQGRTSSLPRWFSVFFLIVGFVTWYVVLAAVSRNFLQSNAITWAKGELFHRATSSFLARRDNSVSCYTSSVTDQAVCSRVVSIPAAAPGADRCGVGARQLKVFYNPTEAGQPLMVIVPDYLSLAHSQEQEIQTVIDWAVAAGFQVTALKYDPLVSLRCSNLKQKAVCLFDPYLEHSPLSALCQAKGIDCVAGISVLSLGKGSLFSKAALDSNPFIANWSSLGANEESYPGVAACTEFKPAVSWVR